MEEGYDYNHKFKMDNNPSTSNPFPLYYSPEVYVGDIPEGASKDDLSDEFSPYGKISSIFLGRDRDEPYGRNAIITYSYIEDAFDAVYHKNYSYMEDCLLRCTFRVDNFKLRQSGKRDFRSKKAKVFLDGVNLIFGKTKNDKGYLIDYPNISDLYQMFLPFGLIYRIRINMEENGRYKKNKDDYFTAVIQFYEEGSARKVFKNKNHLGQFHGHSLVAKREPKEQTDGVIKKVVSKDQKEGIPNGLSPA